MFSIENYIDLSNKCGLLKSDNKFLFKQFEKKEQNEENFEYLRVKRNQFPEKFSIKKWRIIRNDVWRY